MDLDWGTASQFGGNHISSVAENQNLDLVSDGCYCVFKYKFLKFNKGCFECSKIIHGIFRKEILHT